jgi:hypothetical protein
LTFQIPSAALFSALDTLRNTPVATNLPSFKMGPVPDKIRPSEQGELSTTTNGILPLSLTNAQSGEPLVSSSQYDEEISRTDGLFGFSTAPGPWADCFANLLPDSDWMPSTNSCMCHDPVAILEEMSYWLLPQFRTQHILTAILGIPQKRLPNNLFTLLPVMIYVVEITIMWPKISGKWYDVQYLSPLIEMLTIVN